METHIYVLQCNYKHDFKACFLKKGVLIKQGHLSDIFNDGNPPFKGTVSLFQSLIINIKRKNIYFNKAF